MYIVYNDRCQVGLVAIETCVSVVEWKLWICALVEQFSPKKWIQFRSRISSEKMTRDIILGAIKGFRSLQATWIRCEKSRSLNFCLLPWWQVAHVQASGLTRAHYSSPELRSAPSRPCGDLCFHTHDHHATDSALARARARDCCSCGKVYALTLNRKSTFLFLRTQSIGPNHERQQTSILTERPTKWVANVHRRFCFFVFSGPSVRRCREKKNQAPGRQPKIDL